MIIGAGPTGLVLALWLTKLGVKVRIVDKTLSPEQHRGRWRSRPGPSNCIASSTSPTRYSSAVTRRPPLIYGSRADGKLAYRSRT
jgi:cation diffusion facilitator CzcD-associated flavoprotein CzcO